MKEVVFCGRLSGCLEEDCLCRPVLRNGMEGGESWAESKKCSFFLTESKNLIIFAVQIYSNI